MKISRRSVMQGLGGAALAPMAGLAAAAQGPGVQHGPRPIRIAVIYFVHETVTFLPYDTELDDFIYEGSPARGEALLAADPQYSMGGFVKVAREHANVELVGIESPLFPKRGTATGWIDKSTYDHFVNKMVGELKAQAPFDGVYLAVHGAMGVRDVEKPEAELARRVRQVVGPKAFIVGTFDPHGNEDDTFFKYANLGFCVKYYPHYDGYLQGERAARMLIRCIRGDYQPAGVGSAAGGCLRQFFLRLCVHGLGGGRNVLPGHDQRGSGVGRAHCR